MDTQELLRSHQAPWKADFAARAKALPADLQAGVAVLFSGKSYDDKDIFSLLAKKTPDEFRQLIPALSEVFFPQFADTAAHTLEALLTRHIYPQGYERRAFRAPSHPLAVARAASWLHSVWNVTQDYPAQNLEWFAVHAGLLNSWQSHHLGLLLAQAIDDGHTEVFQILKDTASTQHPVARMGRHVPLALLASQSEEAHALAEGLLLAAQRQEGLRQAILESVDEASVTAFIRLLDVVLREDLLRFAAALRAACVWFGLNYDVTDKKTVKGLLGQALDFLRDPDEARRALTNGNGVQVYLALYTLAMQDAGEAATLARQALKSKSAEDRMAAVQFLNAAQMLDKADYPALLSDPDVRIGALAATRVNRWQDETDIGFEDLAAYAERLPKEAKQEALLFPWLGHIPAQSDVLDNLQGTLEGRPLALLAPYLGRMSSYGKMSLLDKVNQRREADPVGALGPEEREMVTQLLQDRNSAVSQKAVEVMAFLTPTPAEVDIAHTLLKRKSADLRRGLIRLLAKDKGQAEASALHLLAQSSTEQRQAGLQLLEEVGAQPPADFKPKNVSEETLLTKLTAPAAEQLTLANGLGLFDPADLSQPKPLTARDHDYPKYVQRGAELLKSLDALVDAHRETPLTGMGYDGAETMLLMNVQPWMLSHRNESTPMPLAELWENWWQSRPDPQDGDLTAMQWALGHYVNRTDTTQAELEEEWGDDADIIQEVLDIDLAAPDERVNVGEVMSKLISALANGEVADTATPTNQADSDYLATRQQLLEATLHRTLGPLVALKLLHPQMLYPIVSYLESQHRTDTDTQLALDAYETALSYLPTGAKEIQHPEYVWRKEDPRDLLQPLRSALGNVRFSDAQFAQFWNIRLYSSAAFPHLPREMPDTGLLLRAYDLGLASKADLTAQLIGPRPEGGYGNRFGDLQTYTRRKLPEDLPTLPDWLAEVDKVRDRVLDVELQRGDLETPATLPALALQSVAGLPLTLRLLSGMGKNPLKRGYGWNNTSKDMTFSHLLRVSFPLPSDNADALKKQAAGLNIASPRLLDLAMFAPQWAGLVSDAVGWKGLESGVYWLHAHTKDNQWSVPEEVREAWEGEISERTPLKPTDLTEGAVDVAWFKAMYKHLGKEHFAALLGAAKYASSSGGHKRAELFAAAILGQVTEAELLGRIKDKRNQDAVRSLGLLPLSKGKKGATELEKRYRVLSDFRREARQFGSQRQASERLAADIGMQNLARTAGYADPQRLMWAMEARTAPDWQQVVTADGVTVRAEMDAAGTATLHVARGDKVLKTLPPAIKKNPELVALQAAVKELGATRSRMRLALEEAMVRGDHFSPQEVSDLAAHPVIAPMLRSLVWVLNEGVLGLWDAGVLRGLDSETPLSDQALRLAHPHDLYTSGQWREWQAHILNNHISQPFKQVFREYYPLTPAEQGEGVRRSVRYQGHHVQPSKAAALLKSRGWVSVYEEGTRKTYHAEGINVWIDDTLGYGTPNEVEGMPLHAAYFMRVGEYEALPLAEVPPRLFSETMRDLDLVVSVAHTGGVDPEASQSTVEMREALLRETLRLLKLKNVRLENQHALIDGHYSQYTVHLGSGTVHRQPGGGLCIVAVHNQAAGRLFLPFADPDPRTAEVVSKVLLLAEDKKIQDPLILEQLT